jgi:flagellar motor switch protein FliM
MNIHEGMVVEIPPFDEVKIFVEGESLFEGSIGERDGKIAVRITG